MQYIYQADIKLSAMKRETKTALGRRNLIKIREQSFFLTYIWYFVVDAQLVNVSVRSTYWSNENKLDRY